ncbi:MAG: Rrf2 family transcriptional regulator [Phycisphaeraceae bacterium]|nr:Rrf2 family transcriptional regulator [Phycisphaeraceae bacterium]
MRLSKRCQYGLKAAARLASRHGDGYVQSREVAEAEALPAKFLESILLAMRSAGLLESKVGMGGGYRLARDPDMIPVSAIIEAVNGSIEMVEPSDPRAIGHQSLVAVQARIDDALDSALGQLTLADLIEPAESAPRA